MVLQRALLANNDFASFAQEAQSLAMDVALRFVGRVDVGAVHHMQRGRDAADGRNFAQTHDGVLLGESVHCVLGEALRAEHVVAVEAAIDRVVVAMTAKDALR